MGTGPTPAMSQVSSLPFAVAVLVALRRVGSGGLAGDRSGFDALSRTVHATPASAVRWWSGRQCDRRLPEPADLSGWAAASGSPDLINFLNGGAVHDLPAAVAGLAIAAQALVVDALVGGLGIGISSRLDPLALV